MRYLSLFLPVFLVLYSKPASAQWKVQRYSPRVLNSIPLQNPEGRTDRLEVNNSAKLYVVVFLSPECPLCRNYTVTLNKLSQSFWGMGVQFYGIISGRSYSAAQVAGFKKNYQVDFPVLIDSAMRLTRYLAATVTPEVKLINSKGELIYSGEIDNWAVSLGQQRTVITENYLQDAIDRGLEGVPAKVAHTRPVGCLINDL